MGLRLSEKEKVRAIMGAHRLALRPGREWQCTDALGIGWAEASYVSSILRVMKRSLSRGEVILGS